MGDGARRGLTRRGLIGGAAAGAAAAGLPRAALAAASRRSADVIVVGAGLAGLTTALDVAKEGHSVLVLEGRNRVGGRVWSRQVKQGEYIDAGAEFIGPTQDRIKHMAKRMGVKTFPTYNTGDNVYWKDGTRLTYPSSGPTGIAPPDPAYLPDIAQIIERLDLMAEDVDPNAPWDAASAEDWDSQTLYTWVKDNQINPDFIRLVSTATQAIFGQEPRDLSLLFTLFYISASGDEDHQGTFERNFQTADGAQQDRFIGGTHQIPQRMAKKLGGSILLGRPVHRIHQSKHGVEVSARGLHAAGKHVVVAIPPTLAGRIEYSPNLPVLRDQLTQRTPMGSYAKVDAVYETPFWRDAGLTGGAVSLNGPVTVTFDSTSKDGSPGILLGFVGGHEARRWFSKPKQKRREEVLDNFANYFGEDARNPIQYVENLWSRETYTRGDPVAGLPPGVLLDFGEALRERVGRIHWAGTETSTYWNGYMDGAVRSGERAAAEVLSKL
jgi:monoamine oxidase